MIPIYIKIEGGGSLLLCISTKAYCGGSFVVGLFFFILLVFCFFVFSFVSRPFVKERRKRGKLKV